MAGVEQANKGMLGMNASTLGLAAGLFVLVSASKYAMDVAKQQTEAENALNNALRDRNALAGKVVKPDAAAHAKIAAAIKAHKDALNALAAAQQGHYIPATHLTELQVMRLQDAEARVAAATGQHRVAALRRLAELQVQYGASAHGASTKIGNLAAAEKRVADTAAKLAAVQGQFGQSIKLTGINAADVTAELKDFIDKNREYISNQYDLYNATAALVRENLNLNQIRRDQGLILDLSASKHISLADATSLVTKAEAGNFKGMKDLLGIATPTIKASDSLAEKQRKIAAALDLAAAKVKKARENVDPLQKSMNSLAITAQAYAVGPGKQFNDAMAAGVGILDLFGQYLLKLGRDDAGWAQLDAQITTAAGNLRYLAIQAGIARLSPEDIARYYSSPAVDMGKGGHRKAPLPSKGGHGTMHPAVPTVHLHGPVTIVHSDAHAKQLSDSIRRVNRSFR